MFSVRSSPFWYLGHLTGLSKFMVMLTLGLPRSRSGLFFSVWQEFCIRRQIFKFECSHPRHASSHIILSIKSILLSVFATTAKKCVRMLTQSTWVVGKLEANSTGHFTGSFIDKSTFGEAYSRPYRFNRFYLLTCPTLSVRVCFFSLLKTKISPQSLTFLIFWSGRAKGT